MPIEPGGVFADEVRVAVAVEIPEMRAFAAHQHRERRVEQDGPRVAAGQGSAGRGVARMALKVRRHVAFLGVAQRLLEGDVASRG